MIRPQRPSSARSTSSTSVSGASNSAANPNPNPSPLSVYGISSSITKNLIHNFAEAKSAVEATTTARTSKFLQQEQEKLKQEIAAAASEEQHDQCQQQEQNNKSENEKKNKKNTTSINNTNFGKEPSSARLALRQKGVFNFDRDVERMIRAPTPNHSSVSGNHFVPKRPMSAMSARSLESGGGGTGGGVFHLTENYQTSSSIPSIGELRGKMNDHDQQVLHQHLQNTQQRTTSSSAFNNNRSYIRPVSSGLESHKAFLNEATLRVANEKQSFSSYSACCEQILSQVKAAARASPTAADAKAGRNTVNMSKTKQVVKRRRKKTKLLEDDETESDEYEEVIEEMDDQDEKELSLSLLNNNNNNLPPSRLIIVTAAMLLFKLSFVLESKGPLIRLLLNEILRGVFENYDEPPECAVGSSFVLKEDQPKIQDVDCSFLLKLPVYFDEIILARERAEAAIRSSSQVRLSLLAASNVASRIVDRDVWQTKRSHFVAWKKTAVRLRVARQAIEQVGWSMQQRKKKRKVFLNWRLGIALNREQRMLELSARNSEALTIRSRELAQRIDNREAELNKQRNLKESYILKSERLEDMLNSLREEVVRLRARLMDSEAKQRAAFEASSGLIKRLELSHINRAAQGPLQQLELEGEVTSRRVLPLNSQGAQLTLKDPFIHIQSVQESRPWRVGNPQSFLVAWINEFIDRMALGQIQGGSSTGSAAPNNLPPSSSSSPSGSMGASSRNVQTSSAFQQHDIDNQTALENRHPQLKNFDHVTNLCPDMCNGRVYTALFNFLGISPHIMNVQFESEGERRAAIVKAAREEGIDCFLRAEDLAKEDELPHMALCTALFCRYCNQQSIVMKQEEIDSIPTLIERSDALLRNLTSNRRWNELHQILQSSVSGVAVQRCFGIVKGASMTGLSGFTPITLNVIKTLRPPATKFSDDTAEDDQRCERLAMSMQSCLGALRGIVLDAFLYYGSYVSTDSLDPYCLDRSAWRKILADNKLNPKRSKGDSLYELLLDLYDHPGFPILSTMLPTPSPVILNIEDWLVGIVRLFFAKIEIHKTPATSIEMLGNLFRAFVVESVCKHVSLLRHADFVAEFGTPDLQNTIRQYREPLRRIYNELTAAPPNRFRLDMFVHLATRLKVPLDPDTELPHCFASVRIALTDRTTIATARGDVGQMRGVDFNGFCALVYVLSQAKMGGNPFALKGYTLELFLTSCFFIHFQGRVPLLRW